MFSDELITPKHLTYETAERVRQSSIYLVRDLDIEQLRMIRAGLADLHEKTTAGTPESEIVFIRGAVVHGRIETLSSRTERPTFWANLWDNRRSAYKRARKALLSPPKKRKR